MRNFILSFLLVIPFPLMAIVDTSNLHTSTPEEGWHGELKLSIDIKSGNTEAETFSTSALVSRQQNRITDYLIVSADYGTSAGSKDSQSVMAHLRRIIYWNKKLDLELFGQVENNPFSRLNYRSLAGGGGRYRLYQSQKGAKILIGLGGFYLQEEIETGESDAGVENLFRGNGYAVISIPINATTHFSSTTYYQPNLEDVEDYRTLEDASLHFTLNKSLAVEMSYHLSFDSKPPIGVDEVDQQFVTTINYRF